VPSTALVDAGPIVALLNRRDRFHSRVLELFRDLADRDGALISTWPVIAEACSLLGQDRQALVLDWIAQTRTEIASIDHGLDFMRCEMVRYRDLPCDFADASLLYAAWRTKVRDIWTLDADFYVYRLPDRSRFTVIPGGQA
jgi:uncharacterized protein